MSRRPALAALLLGAVLATSTATAAPTGTATRRELDAARAAHVEAARRYRDSLQALVELREEAVARAAHEVGRRQALAARDLIARADVEAAERALAIAQAEVDRAREAIREADTVVTEVAAARELAALPPSAPGQVQAGEALVRHDGRAPWSPSALPALERFFVERFGRPLPVSARGQTAAHDRLGFDHREAVDVALHPDSVEGRALMDHLREQSIPFLAFRAARPGVATGVHIHIGEPSNRHRGERGSPRYPPA